ncbi:hypothetical protein Bhyg_17294, partial [Pseudolycoriella hygida]
KDNSIDETFNNATENEKIAESHLEKCDIKAFQWFYERNFDKFFQFVRPNSEKSVQVRCFQYPPSKVLTVTANSAFNLSSHFKSVHKGMNQKLIDGTKKRKLDDEVSNDSEAKNKQMKLISETFLGQIQYFCLTADLWSSRRRAFLGVTIHWICSKTFQPHIDEIIKSFRIPIRKILKIITDGGSNFKKAFKDHQREDEIFEDEDDLEDLTDHLSESSNEQTFLPSHGRCGSHSICLILTSDIKIKKQRVIKKKKELTAFQLEYKLFRETIFDPVLAKCQELFNKQQNSSKAADLVHSYLNRYLVTPSPTRWNSLFDSIVCLSALLDEMPEELLNVTNGLGLERITPMDHAIIKEYIRITENLANALDILQGKYMYQGVFSPTIHKMNHKIKDIQELTYCLPLKTLILKSIEKRFPDTMKDDYLKAMLLHP